MTAGGVRGGRLPAADGRIDAPHPDVWVRIALAAYLALVLGHLAHPHRLRYRAEPQG